MTAEPDRDMDKTVPPRRPPRRGRDTTSYVPPPLGQTPPAGTAAETQEMEAGPLPRLDKFVLEEKIGEGGMGVVYRAYDADLQRRVAIKKIHPKYTGDQGLSEQFVSEARSIAAVTHPNIAQIFSIHAHDEEAPAYFVMEFIDGESAETRVERGGTLSLEEAAEITLQAARGLRAAHRVGIVHRDVKPSNLVLNERGLVKLVDFGLSRPVGELSQQSEKGVVLGTPHYVSPEQSRGWVVDHRADIYSLGCTLFFLLTGRALFEGKTQVELLLAHASDPPPVLTDLRPDATPELVEILERMLAKKAVERYQNYDDVIAALRPILGTDPASTSSPPRKQGTRRAVGLTSFVAIVAVAVLVIEYRLSPPAPDLRQLLGPAYVFPTNDEPHEGIDLRFEDFKRIPRGILAPTRTGGERDAQPYELVGPDLRWKNFPQALEFPFMEEFQRLELRTLRFEGRPDFELRVGFDANHPTRYLRISFGVGRNEEDLVECVLGGQKQQVVELDGLTTQPAFTVVANADYNLRLERQPAASPDRAYFQLTIDRQTELGAAASLVNLTFSVPTEAVGPGKLQIRCENPLVEWSAYLVGVGIRGRFDRDHLKLDP